MTTQIIPRTTSIFEAMELPEDIQIGPPYRCFTCGEPSDPKRERYFQAFPQVGFCHLDALAQHIYYLYPPCDHSCRVARLGDCITPLHLFQRADIADDQRRMAADAQAMHNALAHIARCVPNDRLTLDPAEQIVFGLLAGAYTPAAAIDAIHQLSRLEG
ncbi:MAG TPA: hypothetical protein VIK33_11915 [Anaerolineae bacterium]